MKTDDYPQNDTRFEETTVDKVKHHENGWELTLGTGWSFGVDSDSPVIPKVGMTARFYGKGIGYVVRGLFLNGKKVFYKTEHEQEEYHKTQTYGATAKEWLDRWDSGKTVWTVEMGGLGPGYEQAIQITVAELLRIMLSGNYKKELWCGDSELWKKDRDAIEKIALKNTVLDKLGLSGAQFGVATNLAARLFIDGPIKVLTDDAVKNRLIQVSKHFPSIE